MKRVLIILYFICQVCVSISAAQYSKNIDGLITLKDGTKIEAKSIGARGGSFGAMYIAGQNKGRKLRFQNDDIITHIKRIEPINFETIKVVRKDNTELLLNKAVMMPVYYYQTNPVTGKREKRRVTSSRIKLLVLGDSKATSKDCINCNKEFNKEFKLCPYCGKRLTTN